LRLFSSAELAFLKPTHEGAFLTAFERGLFAFLPAFKQTFDASAHERFEVSKNRHASDSGRLRDLLGTEAVLRDQSNHQQSLPRPFGLLLFPGSLEHL
jgi:hypothetical protein